METSKKIKSELDVLKLRLQIINNTEHFVPTNGLKDLKDNLINQINNLETDLMLNYINAIGSKYAYDLYLIIRNNSNKLKELSQTIGISCSIVKHELKRVYLEKSDQYNS